MLAAKAQNATNSAGADPSAPTKVNPKHKDKPDPEVHEKRGIITSGSNGPGANTTTGGSTTSGTTTGSDTTRTTTTGTTGGTTSGTTTGGTTSGTTTGTTSGTTSGTTTGSTTNGTTGGTSKDKSGKGDNSIHSSWQHSKEGYWTGKDRKLYKLENAKVMVSTDGKTWTPSTDGMWQDMNGNWVMIKNDQLMMSKDNGTTWVAAPDNKWQGADGAWYMFDKNWKLTTMKDKGSKGQDKGTKESKGDKGTGTNNGTGKSQR